LNARKSFYLFIKSCVKLGGCTIVWYVYVIHFGSPYKHAKHYTGIAKNPKERLKEHLTGSGSRLMDAVRKTAIPVVMYVLQEFDDFHEAHLREKQLKAWKKASQYCPMCKHATRQQYLRKLTLQLEKAA